ncbi:MAG: sensor histidine kinase [Phycisphaerales bacterium]
MHEANSNPTPEDRTPARCAPLQSSSSAQVRVRQDVAGLSSPCRPGDSGLSVIAHGATLPPRSDAERQVAELQSRLTALEAQFFRAHRLSTLGTLAASIAHEVNNLLTPILSYAQLALAAPEDADLTRKALIRAADCAEKASRIGSAMLGFARIEESPPGALGPETQMPRANVAAVVADALACLGRDPRKDGIAIEVDIPAGLHAAIAPLALQQAVLNLALNAREAMRARPNASICFRAFGSSELVARRPTTTERGDWARGSTGNITLTIADTGPGIPPNVLARVFQPFVSATRGDLEGPNSSGSPSAHQAAACGPNDGTCRCRDGSRGRTCRGVCHQDGLGIEIGTGTSSACPAAAQDESFHASACITPTRASNGLGLAVTHTLITNAGGTIRVESSPDRGTCFTITLPAAAVVRAAAA